MMHKFIALGINVDHVATLRQARRGRYPDPVHAALAAELAGADSITLHLREDRRHIQVQDVRALKDLLKTRMNLEMAVTDEMLDIARAVRPADCCFVPERRMEVTTEGGLDAASQVQRLKEATAILAGQGIRVALFIDPDPQQIEASVQIGAPVVELHTGAYADSAGSRQATELERLRAGAKLASSLGLEVHAGHGLNYHNVQPVAAITEIVELNIGHSIISRAIFDGLTTAIRDMRALMLAARA
jgi:pyridoxine 5-phosphate synthase